MLDEPLLASLWDMYQLCRTTSLVVFRKPVDTEGSERIVTIVWPTGFAFLPNPGGIERQDYMTMRLMAAFLRGEQQGCVRLMDR